MLLGIVVAVFFLLIVFMARFRARAINAESQLTQAEWKLKLGLTLEGHRLIAAGYLAKLRNKQGDEKALKAVTEHLRLAGAQLQDIGSNVDEFALLAYSEIITKHTGQEPLAYR